MRRVLLVLVLLAVIFYLLKLLYPFYQRYWASCIDQVGGGCVGGGGKQWVDDLETIAYGLSFDEANKLATEMRKKVEVKVTRKDGVITGERVTDRKCVTICP